MADMRVSSIVRELWRSGPGKAGMILLVLQILVSIYVIVTYPLDYGTSEWGNPSLWADNPRSAPPVWTNLFNGGKYPRHFSVTLEQPDEIADRGRAYEHVFETEYELDARTAPSFVSISISNVTYQRRPPVIDATLFGPDGREIDLFRTVVSGPRPGEDSPYRRYVDEAQRTVVGTDKRVIDSLAEYFSSIAGERAGDDGRGSGGEGGTGGDSATRVMRERIDAETNLALFGVPAEERRFEVLPGRYTIMVSALTASREDEIGRIDVVVGGRVYGAMGTDALGRNLAAGLLFGLPVALLIGLATSTVSTMIGMTLGMISGYSGGGIDLGIQRAADIVANIPVLPLLIFLVFVGGSQLWLILLVLVAFSWPGLTIMVRSMVLQLRSGQEVEAAQALGASSFRIIFRHILPHAAAYVLAQLVFFAPSAILAEAGLSFLGLGDPSIPTWGQILEYGFRTGAVFLGYWWWIVPPGVLIVITAVTFMFLALGLEPVVDPRLRGRRSWHF